MALPKKQISFLYWIIELFPDEITNKPMFGGRAFYLNDKILLAAFENPGDRQYKDKICDYDIWNGCLFPLVRENHSAVLKKYPDLVLHPILPKWLYLPQEHENFEEVTTKIIKEINKGSPLFGVIPQKKKKKETKKPIRINNQNSVAQQKNKKISKSKEIKIKIEPFKKTLIPSMFSDQEPLQQVLDKAQKISDLKNLGPSSESHFQKSGIKNAQQFIKLGWKKAMIKLMQTDPKSCHSMYAYALIGALKNIEWNRISEEDKKEAQQFTSEYRLKLRSLKNKKTSK